MIWRATMEQNERQSAGNAGGSSPVELRVDAWSALRQDASAIRHDVFVVEQQVPLELEMDDMDAYCIHAVAYDDGGTPVATGRLLPDGHIGRTAVRQCARGTGIGGQVLRRLIQAARERGDSEVVLSAQVHALGFYARYGFVAEGEVYLDAGIEHRTMSLPLDRDRPLG